MKNGHNTWSIFGKSFAKVVNKELNELFAMAKKN